MSSPYDRSHSRHHPHYTPPPPQPPPRQAARPTIWEFVLRPQTLWFFGHLFLVTNTILYLSGFGGGYYRAWLGALISYGIVVWKTHGFPKFNRQYFSKATADVNVQYLFIALFFWINYYVCSSVLIPYVAFSLFHSLSYVRDSIIPTFFPPPLGPTSGQRQHSLPGMLISRIHNFVQRYQPRTLTLMAYWEILVVMPHLIVQTIMWRQSLFAPYAYAHFLRLRFHLSQTTRSAFSRIRSRIDGLLVRPSGYAPAGSREVWFPGKIWIKLRDLCQRFAESSAPPQNAQGVPASRGGMYGSTSSASTVYGSTINHPR